MSCPSTTVLRALQIHVRWLSQGQHTEAGIADILSASLNEKA